VALLVGDDISTDEILPAGARVLPFRSNIPELARFTFDQVDETYPTRAAETRDTSGHIIVAGANYGQGSSREHAAITPVFSDCARSWPSHSHASTGRTSPISVCSLEFADATDHDRIQRDDVLVLNGIREALAAGTEITVHNATRKEDYVTRQNFSQRQIDMLLAGGLISWLHERRAAPAHDRD
jgi:aconitate hydratase